jgi:hypothetical protein
MTPQKSTQPQATSNHNGDNYENVQQFDEVVSAQQQWPSTSLIFFHTHNRCTYTNNNFDGLQSSQPSPNMEFGTH